MAVKLAGLGAVPRRNDSRTLTPLTSYEPLEAVRGRPQYPINICIMSDKKVSEKKIQSSRIYLGGKELKLIKQEGFEYEPKDSNAVMFELKVSINKGTLRKLQELNPSIKGNKFHLANVYLDIVKEVRLCTVCLGTGSLSHVPCTACDGKGEVYV